MVTVDVTRLLSLIIDRTTMLIDIIIDLFIDTLVSTTAARRGSREASQRRPSSRPVRWRGSCPAPSSRWEYFSYCKY